MPDQVLTSHSMSASGHGGAAEATGVAGFLKVLFRRTMEDKVPILAAALSFFMMLSVVPVLLLALAILGFFMHGMGYDMQHAAQMAVAQMQKGISQVLPGANVQQTFQDLARQINLEQSLISIIQARGTTLITGVLSLTWAALQIFVNASSLMNQAFDVDETRSWLKLRLVALGVTLGASVLFLISLVPTSGPDFVRNLHIPWLGLPNPTPVWVDGLFSLLAIAINMAMFTFIYRFLPNLRVAWADAAVGGIAMGLLWEIAKKGFAGFLAGSTNPMYGALGGVILLITWMYYTNILLLLGAEVAGLYRRVRAGSVIPNVQEAHLRELRAVHAGAAVPVAAAPGMPSVSLDETKEQIHATVQRIAGAAQEIGDTLRHTAHEVKTTPTRHRADREFDHAEPTAADRRNADVAPTAEERRPPHKAPIVPDRERLDPEAEARDRERQASEARAIRELKEGDFPPVEASRQRARQAVEEIKDNIQSIAQSVKDAQTNAPTGQGA